VKKIAILVVVLIIPSVAYLLLQTGKNNYKKLEIFGPKEPVEKTVSGKVVVDTLYHTVGGFSLYDTDSTTICPKMSNQLMRVQHTYGEDKDVAVLSFTVDPLNDSPERLKAYAAKHKAQKGFWYFLTGEKEQIYSMAKNSYFLNAVEGDGTGDAFLHSEQFLLIDKEKHIRGIYDGTDHFEVKRLIEDIAALQNEYKELAVAK
jgi:protein SCO1/2